MHLVVTALRVKVALTNVVVHLMTSWTLPSRKSRGEFKMAHLNSSSDIVVPVIIRFFDAKRSRIDPRCCFVVDAS